MTATPPAPLLTTYTDDNPCPRIDVLVAGIATDAATITVFRNFAGQRSIVRGASNAAVAGDYLITDNECPLQIPVTYSCQTFDSAGTPSRVSPRAVAVTIDEDRAWFQDPLDATSAFPVGLVRVSGGSFGEGAYGDGPFGGEPLRNNPAVFRRANMASVTYSSDVTVSPVFAGSLPVAAGSTRREASEIPIEIRTTDQATTDAFRELVQQTPFPLLRTGDRIPMLPSLAYLAMPDVVESWIPGPDVTIWTATAQSVMGPGQSVLVNGRVYNDLPDEAATYDGLAALYDTYIDMQRGA